MQKPVNGAFPVGITFATRENPLIATGQRAPEASARCDRLKAVLPLQH